MNIIDQTSKTNWKYVAIVVGLTIFLGGSLIYQARLKGPIGDNSTPRVQPGEISRAQIDDCVQDDECILVDYQDCCVPPQIAINKKYKEEYERHPEWQEPSEERLDFCAVVKCASPGTFDSAKCVKNQCVGIEVEKGNRKILDTSTWQTYRNEEFGFEIKYPEKWRVSASKSAGPEDAALIRFSDPQSSGRERKQVSLYISDSPTVSIEEYIDTFMTGRGQYVSSLEDTSIGGIPGKRVVIKGGDVANAEPYVGFLMLERGKLHRWDGTDQDILAQILSTFRFVEEHDTFSWSSSDVIIRVGFVQGTDVEPPQDALSPDLRDSVAGMRRSTTLSEEEIDRINAQFARRWFEIALKDEVDADVFLKRLQAQSNVESAYIVPDPPPPPL